jgi:hypothetical protein
MIHVNQESREEGLKFYNRVSFDENKNPSGITYDAGRYLYYNPKIDYIGVKHTPCLDSTWQTTDSRQGRMFTQASQYVLQVMAGGRTNYIFPMHHSSKSELVRIAEKIEKIVPMTYQGLAASRALLANHAIKLPYLICEIKDRSKCRMWIEKPSNHSVLDEDLIELAMRGSDEEVRRGKEAFDELMVCLMGSDPPHAPY